MRWLVAAVFVCGVVFAQQKQDKGKEKQELGLRVIVGTKTEESPQSLPGWVSVVDSDDVTLWQPFTTM